MVETGRGLWLVDDLCLRPDNSVVVEPINFVFERWGWSSVVIWIQQTYRLVNGFVIEAR